MAESSRPTPDNSHVVSDSEYEQIAAASIADGLYVDMVGATADPGGLAPVYATGSGMAVFVRENLLGAVRGFMWTSGAAAISKTIAANASGSTRIDRIVLELDRSTWNVRTAVVQGTPGFGAPALTRTVATTGKFQIPMAKVTVPNGATSISAGQVDLEAQHIGSPVRSWRTKETAYAMTRGEIGFDEQSGRWFGFTGTARNYITDAIDPDPVGFILADGGTTKSKSLVESLTGQSGFTPPTFVAGRKGKAIVWLSCQMKTDTNFQDCFMGVRIRKVSDNSIVHTSSDDQCTRADSLNNTRPANHYVVSGLTAGASYKFQPVWKVQGGTGTFDTASITIDPR